MFVTLWKMFVYDNVKPSLLFCWNSLTEASTKIKILGLVGSVGISHHETLER